MVVAPIRVLSYHAMLVVRIRVRPVRGDAYAPLLYAHRTSFCNIVLSSHSFCSCLSVSLILPFPADVVFAQSTFVVSTWATLLSDFNWPPYVSTEPPLSTFLSTHACIHMISGPLEGVEVSRRPIAYITQPPMHALIRPAAARFERGR